MRFDQIGLRISELALARFPQRLKPAALCARDGATIVPFQSLCCAGLVAVMLGGVAARAQVVGGNKKPGEEQTYTMSVTSK